MVFEYIGSKSKFSTTINDSGKREKGEVSTQSYIGNGYMKMT